MKIALAQFNATVGDLAGNASRIRALAADAAMRGARLMITPELALCGYPPEDLALRPDFYTENARVLGQLAADMPAGLAVLIGFPLREGSDRYNAAALLRDGRVEAVYRKQLLPNHAVFDEVRTFMPGQDALVFAVDGRRFGVVICEDIWQPGPAEQAVEAGAECLLVINASPFHKNKLAVRQDVVRARARACERPVVYVNLVGGQDELVFDGGSFALSSEGRLSAQFPMFEEGLYWLDLGDDGAAGEIHAEPGLLDCVYRALVLGVRDYVGKNGFPGVIIGSSGGIDSALTLCIAADALGADRVQAVMMPSAYTAGISVADAQELADNLGVRHAVLPIGPMFDSFRAALAGEFAGLPEDLTEENIQARVRGVLLMALSNKSGHMVLTTGNKSEMAAGYATLYGDMAGGFSALKDVSKTLVWQLARHRNTIAPVIPERIITRPPSAELRPDQTDQDSLPPYDVLDAILERYMEDDQSIESIVAAGFERTVVERVTRLIKLNEYKRRQAPVGIRITHRAFGRDWRYPITSRFRA